MSFYCSRYSTTDLSWSLSGGTYGSTYLIYYRPSSSVAWINCDSGTASASGYCYGTFSVSVNADIYVKCTTTDATGSEYDVASTTVSAYESSGYSVSVSAVPSAGGSVSGGGTYEAGDTCEITAYPNTGYSFSYWYDGKGGTTVSSNPYSFNVYTDYEWNAYFEQTTIYYTVTTSTSGGGTVTTGGSVASGQSITLTATPLTGYSFSSWYRDGELYSTNSTINPTITANTSFVAYFDIDTWAVSYYSGWADGGSVPASQTKYYNTTLTLQTNSGSLFRNETTETSGITSTVNGNGGYIYGSSGTFKVTSKDYSTLKTRYTSYTFDGWATSADGAKAYNAGGSYTGNAALSLYPHFSGQASDWSYGTFTLPTASECKHPDGKTLLGFNTNSYATTATYSPGQALTPTDDDTYYAIWQTPTYTIGVTSNDTTMGTVSISPAGGTYSGGTEVELTATRNSGYKFMYWTQNGSQISDINPWTFNVSADADYVGNFREQSKYLVQYNAGTATSGTAPTSHYKLEDETLTLRANTGNLARTTVEYPVIAFSFNAMGGTSSKTYQESNGTKTTNYTCNGWGDDDTGFKLYDLGGSYTTNSAITLYPSWSISEPTTIWTSVTTPTAEECKRTGYTLNGWDTSEAGTTIQYLPGATIEPDGTGFTLYAVWTPTKYTITFQTDGHGTVSRPTIVENVDTAIVTDGNKITVGSFECTATANTGYIFNNWHNNTGTLTENRTITAYFSPLYTYVISYDANGGTGAPESQTVAVVTSTSITTNLSSTIPTRDNYSFTGWKDTDGNVYNAGASITLYYTKPSLTLTAQWEINTYTITYQPGDYASETSIYTQVKTHGSGLTLRGESYTPDSSKTGYKQTGWSLLSNGSVKSYELSEVYNGNNALTLYPYWTPPTKYTITVQAGTGGQVTTGASGSYMAGTKLELACSVNTGYKFVNWTENGVECASTQAVSEYFTPAYNATVQCNFEATQYWNWSKTIATGQPITNLTATDWNDFTAKINEVRAANSYPAWTFTTATQGNPFTAAMFNQAVEALSWADLAKTTSITSITEITVTTKSSGNRILASYFEGTGSLKYALNKLMDVV